MDLGHSKGYNQKELSLIKTSAPKYIYCRSYSSNWNKQSHHIRSDMALLICSLNCYSWSIIGIHPLVPFLKKNWNHHPSLELEPLHLWMAQRWLKRLRRITPGRLLLELYQVHSTGLSPPGQSQDAVKGDYVSKLPVGLGMSGDSPGRTGIYGSG